jgi:glycosyltransferase involved in cell wall biosynthesis
MRIALIHYTGPARLGGVESILRQHAQLLLAHGHSVLIIAGKGLGAPRPNLDLIRVPLMAATDRRQVRLAKDLNSGSVPAPYKPTVDQLHEALLVALRRCDVVFVHNALTLHFNLALTDALARLAARQLRGKVVAWTHDIAAINPLYRRELFSGDPWDLVRRPLDGVRYVCISEQRRDELIESWRVANAAKTNITVIPNGIDPRDALEIGASIGELAERFRLVERDAVLLLPARATRRKNIELAIDTVAILVAKSVDAVLLVTGPAQGHHPGRSQEYVQELRERSKRHRIQDRVVFVAETFGRNPTAYEVSRLYRLASVLIFPSVAEGFGLPILEGGLNRLPMLALDLPVMRELGGDALFTVPRDASADTLAEGIESILESPAARLRRRVLTTYSWSAIYERKIAPFLESFSA